jgi:UDP-glucose 4-epimerase
MKIAITGISSALGQVLVPKLQSDSTVEKIIGIDLTEYKDKEKIDFFKLDVRDKEGIEHALKGADALIHLAFIVIPNKLPNLKTIYDINVNGSQTVFQAAANNNVKKILYLSSQSVYGHVPESPKIVNEDSPRLGIRTTNFYYSHTKALVEEFLDGIEANYPNIAVIRLRPPIITGPHFMQNLGLLNLQKKRIFTIPSINHDGKMPIQLIHEDDLTDVIILALKSNKKGAYNVASNIIPDLEEFAESNYGVKVRRIPPSLAKIAVRFGRFWTKLRWGQAILYNSLLNTEKIERELNWKPKYSTEQCIEEINREIS